ncbi:pyrrolo-quinoline quinone [Bremerella cremea]|uniref:Pyrrolo-quinoline quinone n=1 Tax=Blastopirellula marina TaxID=124 RepID=A0A2S8FQF0_9BACT|nr:MULTISPECIES: PQQ-binding-like beta-propeller repeat protein [Pirellulaceae]PQO34416.1 pyrrolo-quinoline quinone [Blastopirellula marina]RCS46912.1 pyrrolo-quinoline quinone [Bremerella cremea]
MPLSYFGRLSLAFFSMLVFGIASPGLADDWPQWMGPQRDDVLREDGIIESIPDEGLKVKWRVPVAGGYAGPAVAGGRVFLTDYVADSNEIANDPGARQKRTGQERIQAFDVKTGKRLWEYAYERTYEISYAVGPRCTPTVDGSMVYMLGAEGDLICLDVETGGLIWRQSLKEDFGAEIPTWGCASHPLVFDDLLITMVGGEGQGVVAFNKKSGEVEWKSLDCKMGYAPPSVIEVGQTKQLIVYHPEGVVSLKPEDGTVYWEIPLTPSYEMSIARPMVDGNKMYASGIRTESVMMELDENKPAAKELWRGKAKNAVYSGTSTPLFVDGVIYGSDCNDGCLVAADAKNGDRLWTTFDATVPGVTRYIGHGTCFLTRIGDSHRYLIFSEVGDLLVAELTAEGFKSLGRFHVLEPTSEAFGRGVVWTHPAFADKTGYFRNDKELVAVDLEAK